jgi:hypothetical protein
VETRISILGWDCYVGGDDVLRNQRRSPMLKKILATGLFGSILLSLPLQAQATVIQYGTSKASGAMVTQNTLSASDRQAIRNVIINLMKALNSGNSEGVVRAYSSKYQSSEGGNYQSVTQGAGLGTSILKAYGIIFKSKSIQIEGVSKNRAIATVKYEIGFTSAALAKMSSQQRDRANRLQPAVIRVSLEKDGGRWLIVNEETLSSPVPSNSSVATSSPANPPASTQDRTAVKALFARHIQALNKEDLKGYLATLDANSSKYEQVKQQTAQLFKDYNLKYEMKSLEIVSLNGNTGVVKMVATVKRVGGGGFTDSKIVTFNTINKSKGKWQIADTEVESLTSLR